MKKLFEIEWMDDDILGTNLATTIEWYLNRHRQEPEFKVTEIQPHCHHPVSAIVASDEMRDCAPCFVGIAQGSRPMKAIKRLSVKPSGIFVWRSGEYICFGDLKDEHPEKLIFADMPDIDEGMVPIEIQRQGVRYGFVCPECGHAVEDADYWDEKSGTCLRCALE